MIFPTYQMMINRFISQMYKSQKHIEPIIEKVIEPEISIEELKNLFSMFIKILRNELFYN